ncbi:hypothetical protein BN7_3851 [Wickerhamomyces ciferrii]|uniref:Uncharacterized protein n=1 Tax=Wickerhamomyces ciferrii (strain ATCC 14091 / BCRC 22168 / CBS 111 / JCM 3599 / NBRC 0793 / NRRL Y-1031 F-60-10) TaxID=1206466 RepID=K0KSI4_WICCF|nr:uncharacterized protein BN7_3851 [Wickerhamomyces ciferrii]CCH44289.1 hypothetical protein BN7_3851 [Wickerhamomyces ciferrii]
MILNLTPFDIDYEEVTSNIGTMICKNKLQNLGPEAEEFLKVIKSFEQNHLNSTSSTMLVKNHNKSSPISNDMKNEGIIHRQFQSLKCKLCRRECIVVYVSIFDNNTYRVKVDTRSNAKNLCQSLESNKENEVIELNEIIETKEKEKEPEKEKVNENEKLSEKDLEKEKKLERQKALKALKDDESITNKIKYCKPIAEEIVNGIIHAFGQNPDKDFKELRVNLALNELLNFYDSIKAEQRKKALDKDKQDQVLKKRTKTSSEQNEESNDDSNKRIKIEEDFIIPDN